MHKKINGLQGQSGRSEIQDKLLPQMGIQPQKKKKKKGEYYNASTNYPSGTGVLHLNFNTLCM
jgi:hypothetical protein